MARKFGPKISNAEMRLARRFEAAGLTSISQAAKADGLTMRPAKLAKLADRIAANNWTAEEILKREG